jgi:hypothetical protein
MDKKYLHHTWTKFRAVRPWYFLVLAVVSSGICIYALRSNNLTMVKLRNDVYTVDKNNGDVNAALKSLQAYVTAHMNTNLSNSGGVYPPIQLQYTYERLQQAANQQAGGTNQALYTDAEYYCQQQDPTDFSGHNRVPCIEKYVQDHGLQVTSIPASLYEFNFLSPTWSPDLAGWSMVASALLLLLFIVSWIVERWLKHQTK